MRQVFMLAFGAALALGSGAVMSADLKEGEKVFKKCAACHTLEAGKKRVGPSLHGIFGSKAAAMEGFKYSKAMRESGITWDDATLDAYLENPRQYIKGNRMAFPGLKKAEDRENVIAYIKENGK